MKTRKYKNVAQDLLVAATILMPSSSQAAAASLDQSLELVAETERPVYDRKLRVFTQRAVVRNVSGAAVPAPLSLALNGFDPPSSSLVLDTVHGVLASGDSFVELMGSGSIESGAELPVEIHFRLDNGISRVAAAALEKLADRSIRSYQPESQAAFRFDYDLVRVPAGNRAPVARSGQDWFSVPGAPVALDGSASSDADGDPLTYRWTMTGKPALSQSLLSAPEDRVTELIPDVAGEYMVALVVNDGYDDSLPDTVLITVSSDGTVHQNQNPEILSSAETKAKGTRPYQYQVQASDPDGDAPLTYSIKASPMGMTISTTGLIQWIPPQPHHDGMQYPVTVEVSDGRGGMALQSFSITVSTCTCN